MRTVGFPRTATDRVYGVPILASHAALSRAFAPGREDLGPGQGGWRREARPATRRNCGGVAYGRLWQISCVCELVAPIDPRAIFRVPGSAGVVQSAGRVGWLRRSDSPARHRCIGTGAAGGLLVVKARSALPNMACDMGCNTATARLRKTSAFTPVD